MDGAPLPRTLRENKISQDELKRVLGMGVSLSVGAPLGNLGGGVLLLGTLRDYGRRALEMELF